MLSPIPIVAIEGEVTEMGPTVATAGEPYVRVKVGVPDNAARRMNLWLPVTDTRGLALGTRVRVLVEVMP